jgi:ParB family chromosome partitioning protein
MIDQAQQSVMLATQQQQTKQVASLRVDEVRPKASQVRKSFSDIQALASSMLQEGQIQPIVVSPKNSEGYYLIQQGERRWRACQQAGMGTIEAVISDPKASELDEIAGELIENIQREALSPLEIANALHCFVQQGWQQKAIAGRLGKTSSFVSTHLSLLKMNDSLLALYQANMTRDTETLNNLRQLYDLDPHTGERVCQAALEEGITRQQSRELLNEAKKGVKKAQGVSKRALQPRAMLAEHEQEALSVPEMPAMSPEPPEPLIKGAAVCVPGMVAAVAVNAVPARIEVLPTLVESDSPEVRVAEVASAGALSTEMLASESSWRLVPATALRIIVNILSDADFQQGVLMTDRVDHHADYLWAKICPGGQEKLVRVPAADIELVRLEALALE